MFRCPRRLCAPLRLKDNPDVQMSKPWHVRPLMTPNICTCSFAPAAVGMEASMFYFSSMHIVPTHVSVVHAFAVTAAIFL